MTLRNKEVTKDQLVQELNSVVADTEQLLRSVATAGGEKADGLRASVKRQLENAGDRLRDLQHAAAARTGAAARATDHYVHQHPWRSIGIAAGVVAVAVLAMDLLLRRRD